MVTRSYITLGFMMHNRARSQGAFKTLETLDMNTALIVATAWSVVCGVALAAPVSFQEQGDAGDLPASAQHIPLAAMFTVSGSTSPSDLVDMYLFAIGSPATFSASTVGGAGWNTQLFLFSTSGLGIAANDDAGPTQLQSMLPSGHPLYAALPAGNYLLAISGSGTNPLSAGGTIFPASPLTGVLGATGAGGTLPVTSWSQGGATGSYTISVTGGIFPAPPSIGLLGLITLAGRRHRCG